MRKEFLVVIFVMVMLGTGLFALAVDEIPDLGTPTDSRGDYEGLTALSDEAYSGNVTAINPNFTSITQTWQGYYGNITATIVLDNAQNKSMYDWSVTTPTGTVFAVNKTISSWDDVDCFNFTDPDDINLSILEQDVLNCSGDDDCVQATFSTTTHDTVWVGTNSFTNECNATKTYTNDGTGTSFDEVLLWDHGEDALIYATVIHNDETSFEGGQADFQLLVGEDGHSNTLKTTYYFYIELT